MRSREFVNEAVIATVLASWIQREARAWLSRKIRAATDGALELPDLHSLVNRQVNSMLGAESPKMGSVITAFVINLIERGNPIEAAVATARSELRRAGVQLVGEPVRAQIMSSLVDLQAVRNLEPLADRWEQTVTQAEQPAIQPGQTVIEPKQQD